MFQPNHSYTKKDIYNILKVPATDQRGDWDTGYHKYNDAFYIFVNIGVSGRTGHDYNNHWANGDLVWYSRRNAKINHITIQELLNPTCTVHIFIRQKDRDPFTYKGVGKAKTVTGSAPVEVTWTLKDKDFIDPDKVWPQALASANDLLKSGVSFYSPKQAHEYKIVRTTRNKIVIQRLDVESKTTEDLTAKTFHTAVTKINEGNGSMRRTSLYKKNVAIETTLVELIRDIDWDYIEDNIEVIVDSTPQMARPIQPTKITEARDDREKARINAMLRVRGGQNKLRKNLFKLYQGKCCITGFHIKDTLHACHLIPHAESGNNNSTNALLLRSDIHDLFDSGLIGIHPKTLKIAIHNSLLSTEYVHFNGKSLSERTDKLKPDFNALKKRWKLFIYGN